MGAGARVPVPDERDDAMRRRVARQLDELIVALPPGFRIQRNGDDKLFGIYRCHDHKCMKMTYNLSKLIAFAKTLPRDLPAA